MACGGALDALDLVPAMGQLNIIEIVRKRHLPETTVFTVSLGRPA